MAAAADDWMIFSDPVTALSSPMVATSYHSRLQMWGSKWEAMRWKHDMYIVKNGKLSLYSGQIRC